MKTAWYLYWLIQTGLIVAKVFNILTINWLWVLSPILSIIVILVIAIIGITLTLNHEDPVLSCKLYRECGCHHVDGLLCDFPYCSMNEEYVKSKKAE